MAESNEAAKLTKRNNAAFTLAVFGLFVPFVGLVCGVVGFFLANSALREARAAGVQLDRNARTFSIVVMLVWGALWLLVLIPALSNRK